MRRQNTATGFLTVLIGHGQWPSILTEERVLSVKVPLRTLAWAGQFSIDPRGDGT